MEIKTLYDNKWLSLKTIIAPEKKVEGYVFSHETRCQGKIISILPYQIVDGKTLYLLRKEVTPCWGFDPVISSITGGYEGGDPRDTVILELNEEAGYDVELKHLLSLGTCFASKSSDTVYYLYSVNLTKFERHKSTGDGSELEKLAECIWLEEDIIPAVKDPLVSVLFIRLKSHI
jgi:hypothetical protein